MRRANLAVAGPPPPRPPPPQRPARAPLRPLLLEKWGAVTFTLSASLTMLFASSAWPGSLSAGALTSPRILVLQTLAVWATMQAVIFAWLARTTRLAVMALVALPLLARLIYDLPAKLHVWSEALAILAALYLLLSIANGIAVLARLLRHASV
jgi:hypothetical protein